MLPIAVDSDGKSARLLSIAATAFASACLLLSGCTPPQMRAPLLLESAEPVLTGSSAVPFRGSAAIEVRSGNERAQGRMDIVWRSDRDFAVTFYSPLGTVLGWMKDDGRGANAGFGDSTWTVAPDAGFTIPGVFTRNPLTFLQVIRILTGRLPCEMPAEAAVDSVTPGHGGAVVALRTGCMLVEVVTSGNFRRMRQIRSHGVTPDSWSCVYSQFSGERAMRIEADLGDGNSFTVRYDRIILLQDPAQALRVSGTSPVQVEQGIR